jgi:hypothetical protein
MKSYILEMGRGVLNGERSEAVLIISVSFVFFL